MNGQLFELTELRARRRQLGLRQADVAALAGVSERFVRDLEGGKPSARLDVLTRVLDVLGLEMCVRLRGGGQLGDRL